MIVVFLLFCSLSFGVFAATNIDACQNFSVYDVYVLTKDVSTTTTCFSIPIKNVTLDCDGYTISGDGGVEDSGVLAWGNDATNVTIKDCIIDNFGDGISFGHNTNESLIYNNTIANGTYDSISFTGSSNNNVSLNTIYGGVSGIVFYGSIDNTLEFNIIYNHSNQSIFLQNDDNNINSTGNTIYNNTLYDSDGNFINFIDSSNSFNISYNVMYNSTGNGINIGGSSNGFIIGNTVYSVRGGFDVINISNITIASNTLYLNPRTGISLDNVSDCNISENTIHSGGFENIVPTPPGLQLIQADNNNISYNTIYNNSGSGIYFAGFGAGSSGNRIFANTIHNHSAGAAISLQDLNSINHIYDNPILDDNQRGIFLYDGANNTNITSNIIRRSSLEGIRLSISNNNNLTSNTIERSSTSGIFFEGGGGNLIEGSTLINNTISQIDVGGVGSTVSIGGIINITQTADTSLDFNITTGAIINDDGLTAIVTDNGRYKIHNASNVEIKSLSLASGGAAEYGCPGSGHINCTLVTNSSNVINITNITGGGYLDLTMYYNRSEIVAGAADIEINISRYNASGWNSLGQTSIDTSEGLVNFTNINRFSTFGVVFFNHICSGDLMEDYTLTENVTTVDNCFTFGANNITLSCDNYTITGDGGGSDTGVLAENRDGILINDCYFYNFGVGANFTNTNNSNMTGNQFFNMTNYGIYVKDGNNNRLLSNNVSNSSDIGLYVEGGDINLTFTHISNSTNSQYTFINTTLVRFLNYNWAVNTPDDALDINASDGANASTMVSTPYNNFTTDDLEFFFDNLVDMEVKTLTLTEANISAFTQGCPYEGCQMINGTSGIINFTNNSASSNVDLGIYFENSSISGISPVKIQMASYNSSSGVGWEYWGRSSIDSTSDHGFVRYDNQDLPGIFGVVIFKNFIVNDSIACRPDGLPGYTTIQSAINAADAGDNVVICRDGTHSESATINVNKSVNLHGNQTDTQVNLTFSGSLIDVFNVSATGANISNLTISDSSGADSAAIYINASNVELSSLELRNNHFGIYTENASNLQVSNVTIEDNSYGVYFYYNADTSIIGGSYFENNSIAHIKVSYSDLNLSGEIDLMDTEGLEFNITNGATVYDDGLDYIETIGDLRYKINNASSLQIKTLNLTDSGVSETGCGSSSFSSCTLVTNSSGVLNITNLTAAGYLDLTMHYNRSEASSLSLDSDEIKIGRYNSNWQEVGQTSINTSEGFVNYTSISSFSMFGVVGFLEPEPVVNNGGGSTDPGGRNDPTTDDTDDTGDDTTTTTDDTSGEDEGETVIIAGDDESDGLTVSLSRTSSGERVLSFKKGNNKVKIKHGMVEKGGVLIPTLDLDLDIQSLERIPPLIDTHLADIRLFAILVCLIPLLLIITGFVEDKLRINLGANKLLKKMKIHEVDIDDKFPY